MVKQTEAVGNRVEEYIKRNWEFLAATAWAGYEKYERGVVVIHMNNQVDGYDEHHRAYYMSAAMDLDGDFVTEFIQLHSEKLMPGGEWYLLARGYDYNREVVFAIDHEGEDLPTFHRVSCGDYMPSPQEAFTLLSGRGLFGGAVSAKLRKNHPAAELTLNEAKLLSFYKELMEGFIPLEWFVELAERMLAIEDVRTTLVALQEKDVLYCEDGFDDTDREEFGLLPQGDDAISDYVMSVGVTYEPTAAKYLT